MGSIIHYLLDDVADSQSYAVYENEPIRHLAGKTKTVLCRPFGGCNQPAVAAE
jgi:hypothetical protein